MLWASAFRYTYTLWDQTYYLSDTFGVSLLSFMAFVVWLVEPVFFCASLLVSNHGIGDFSMKNSELFSIGAHIMGLVIIA